MKSNLYTRTGDGGMTSLVDGSRARKDSARIEAYGEIDELSSAMGLIEASERCPAGLRNEIRHIQHIMFEIGSYLATPTEGDLKGLARETAALESQIDRLDAATPPMKSFILPGGSEESARCHLARTICRRAERRIITLGSESYVDPEVIKYINRLSDYLFIAARYLNHANGVEDVAWERQL